MESIQCRIKLSNGTGIPCIGYGTWQSPSGEVARDCVCEAITKGYRHIDAAAGYNNEQSVGEGIKKSGISRKDIFVTSKLKNTDRGYNNAIKACEKTLADLQLKYLDLYLLHWPANAVKYKDWDSVNIDTWQAMIQLYKTGKVKAIGVCNFLPHHLESLMETEIPPMVNQLEFHPGYMQKDTIAYSKNKGMLIEAWSPLGSGRMLKNKTLTEIASKYNKSVAQICIRWCLQHNVVPLPKSLNPERIIQNTQVFDFCISNEDMNIIDHMPETGFSGSHPDLVPW